MKFAENPVVARHISSDKLKVSAYMKTVIITYLVCARMCVM